MIEYYGRIIPNKENIEIGDVKTLIETRQKPLATLEKYKTNSPQISNHIKNVQESDRFLSN